MVIRKSRIRQVSAFNLGVCLTLYFPLLPPIKVVDVAVLLTFLVYAGNLQKPTKPMIFLVLSVLVVFIATYMESLREGHLTNDVITTGISSIIALMAFIIVASMRSKDLEGFVSGFVASVVVVSGVSMLSVWGVIPEVFPQYSSVYGVKSIGGMPDVNRFGFVLVAALCLLLPAAVLLRNLLTLWAAGLITVISIILLGQRSAIFFTSITLFVAFFLFSVGKWRDNGVWIYSSNKLAGLLVMILGVVSIATFLPTKQIDSFLPEEFSSAFIKFLDRGVFLTEDPRVDKARAGFEVFLDHPLIGHGFNGFSQHAGAGSSHNYFIEILVNGGILGSFFFLNFLVLVGIQIFKSVVRVNNQLNNWVIMGGFLLYFSLVGYGLVLNIHYLVTAYALFGLLANKGFITCNKISKPLYGSQPSG